MFTHQLQHFIPETGARFGEVVALRALTQVLAGGRSPAERCGVIVTAAAAPR